MRLSHEMKRLKLENADLKARIVALEQENTNLSLMGPEAGKRLERRRRLVNAYAKG